jgi:hypothetical protein
MLKTFLITFLLLFQFPWLTLTETGRSKTASGSELASGSVVCPPALSKGVPSDCLPLGPSEYVAQSIAKGIPYPLIPLPAYAPDRSLADFPYKYFKVTEAGAPLFSSLADAKSNTPSKILYPSNHLYVSYLSDAVKAGKDYYYPLSSGYWVLAEGGRLAHYDPPFQGLLFSSTPRNAFGWVRVPGGTQSRTAPDLNSPANGVKYNQFRVVQIYATQKVDNLTWNLLGPGEWIEASQIDRVDPNPVPPSGVTGNRWISVNLFEQTVTIYDHNRLVFATMASTGVDHFWTRPGLFQIQKKLESTIMSNSVTDDFYYLEDVPWTMYFDEGRALHGAYWHNNFGYQNSHGCINLSPGDAHWLYNWASEGDYVYVYDPSGQTPTDPSLFGTGAP